MKTKYRFAAALFALCAAAQAQTASFGQNLIVNGDAEGDLNAWSVFDGYNLFQHVDYGNNWVKPSEPGPANRGANLFAGDGARAAGYQLLDLGGLPAHAASYSLTGWLGGWSSQGDNALFYVSFLDANDNSLGGAQLGPVTPAQRGNKTGLLFREASGVLPDGTSKLMFSLSMERLGGGDNDGYADNLSFVLTAAPVPEPQSWLLMGLGLAAMGLWVRRRKA